MKTSKYVASAGDFSVSFDGRFWECGVTHAVSSIQFPSLSNALYYMYFRDGVNVSALECVAMAERIKALGERKAHNAWIMEGIEP